MLITYRGAQFELSPAQARMLRRVAAGPRTFTGVARRPAETLARFGLVTAEFDADLDKTKGRLRWRITVTITDAGRAALGWW